MQPNTFNKHKYLHKINIHMHNKHILDMLKCTKTVWLNIYYMQPNMISMNTGKNKVFLVKKTW